jgi:hypothetical protein
MSEFEAYYGPEMETKLLRMDLVRSAPQELAWLETLGLQVKPLIEYLDAWLEVPRETLRRDQGFEHWGTQLRNQVTQYLEIIKNLKAGSDAQKMRGDLERHANEMKNCRKEMKAWEHVVFVYMLMRDMKEVRRYLELMASLNSLVTGFQDTLLATRKVFEKGAEESLAKVTNESHAASALLGEKADYVLKAVDKLLQETAEKFNATLAEAAMYKEKTKKVYEDSRDYYQQQAMTAFGDAFNEEAKMAEKKVKAASWWVGAFIALLVLAIAGFVVIEVGGWGITTADPKDLWRWSMLRISVVAFFGWFIGHFFRERKNFLHVAVANRHRRNLCNAYVAFAEKMSPEERTKYLEEIVPQLAVLGKTGFITKEEVADTPGGQMFKTCVETFKPK